MCESIDEYKPGDNIKILRSRLRIPIVSSKQYNMQYLGVNNYR